MCYVEITSVFGGYHLKLSNQSGCSYSSFQILCFIIYGLFFVFMIGTCFCACCIMKKARKQHEKSINSTGSGNGNQGNTYYTYFPSSGNDNQNGVNNYQSSYSGNGNQSGSNHTYFPSSGSDNQNGVNNYQSSYSGNSAYVPILQQQYPLPVCFEYSISL